MRERHEILSEVLSINREIEEKQEQINKLYIEAKNTIDSDDDEKWRNSYLSCIGSYAN